MTSLLSSLKTGLARLHGVAADLAHRPLRRHGIDPFFKVFPEFVSAVAAMPAPTVLELGARNVTGRTQRQLFPGAGRYIGFDIHDGEGVDLVGDAHRLSDQIAASSVDAVFCVSVFEHLVYPWRVALEINRVLRPGGLVFVSTHPSWPAHELPWDFWRFPVGGLAALFAAPAGFELVRAAEGLPAKIYSLSRDPATRGVRSGHVNLGVAVLARKVADYDPDKLRWEVDIAEVVRTEYPKPT
jgi:SAM-dependent methyltransferase